MAESNFRGPVNSMGSLEVEAGTAATIEPMDGPSGFYQGIGWLDPHNLFSKDGIAPARQPAWMICGGFNTVDAVPQAASTTALAAATTVATSVPVGLITAAVTNYSSGAASLAWGVPVVPAGTSVATSLICLDFGFTTGTTTANSTVVQVADSSLFTLGQWVTMANVANASGTASMFAQVASISTSNTTTINISVAAATALGIPIGNANLYGAAFYPIPYNFGASIPQPTAHNKAFAAGFLRFSDPREQLTRNLSIAASTLVNGTFAFLCTGLDYTNATMTELITATGTTTAFGKKGFKYIISVVPQQGGGTATYSVGFGDTMSFPFRVDYAQQLEVWAGNSTLVNNVGFTAAVVTPATNTSGDVRGTLQFSGLGAGTPISQAATSNNVLRWYVIQDPKPYAMVSTTPNNLTPMLGTAQSIV
jgi:hypothetical protein